MNGIADNDSLNAPTGAHGSTPATAQRMQQLYLTACSQNNVAVWTVDIPHRCLTCPDGGDCSDLINKDVIGVSNVDEYQIAHRLIHPDDVDAYRAMYHSVWEGAPSVTAQLRHWSEKNHRFVWLEYHFTLVELEGDAPKTAFATARDISAEKEIESRFAEMLDNRNFGNNTLLAYTRVNLSKRVVEEADRKYLGNTGKNQTPLEFAQRATALTSQNSLKLEDLDRLSIDSLLHGFANGAHKQSCSYWAILKSTKQRSWVTTECTIIERMDDGNVIAFFYTYDRTAQHLKDSMLSDLSQHSFERTGAIFVPENELHPILELGAAYSPYWDGVSYDEGARRYCRECVVSGDSERVAKQMSVANVVQHLAESPRYTVQYDVIGEDGMPKRKQTEYSYLDETTDVILLSRTDIALYEQLRFLSEHDPLTGLFNRTKLYRSMRRMLDENPDTDYLFAQVDIDRFNLYNSSFGEEEGDRLLEFVADLLRDSMSSVEGCVYARSSADVFCVMMPADAQKVVKLLEASNERIHAFRSDYALRLSCGVYLVEDHHVSVEEIAFKAAIASKKCKNNYETAISFYEETEERNQRLEAEIANTMEQALAEKQFAVYLQPKYLVAGDVPCGAEALVRWIHPDKGMISPGAFIPVFERNGFIAKLDQFMWESVCELLRGWIDQGFDPNPVSVNISRISLYNPNLVQLLSDMVARHDIPARLLQLEITESAAMTNPEMMRNTISQLHGAGFTILMDDFGSGYSSLNTLKDFPVDILKVDMAFLPNEENAQAGEIIIASVIRMAQWLGMSVIMEGVETRKERDFLEGVGCDSIQGYFYSRPIPAADYERDYIRSTPEPLEPSPVPKVAPSEKKTVLIVDDAQITCRMVSHILEPTYNTVSCSSAEEALTLLKRQPDLIDLMIVDNMMAGMSGMDLLEYCHEDPQLSAIPKFMMTANAETRVHMQALKLGVSGFFSKPIDQNLIMTYVQRELGGLQARTRH